MSQQAIVAPAHLFPKACCACADDQPQQQHIDIYCISTDVSHVTIIANTATLQSSLARHVYQRDSNHLAK
jgi:hypothetical protein